MVRIGRKAPDFTCKAVVNNAITTLSLNDLAGRYSVIFFYPLNFTFVCPTELHAFQDALAAFKEKDCDVYAVSIDSVYAHLTWLKTPKKVGGIENVTYPLLSDINKSMALAYNVLSDDEDKVALRGLFILDRDNIVQHMTINNLGIGRNTEEVIRVLSALQHHEQHGDVCPANWTVGEPTMKPDSTGLQQYFN